MNGLRVPPILTVQRVTHAEYLRTTTERGANPKILRRTPELETILNPKSQSPVAIQVRAPHTRGPSETVLTTPQKKET